MPGPAVDYVVVDTDAFSYLWQKKPEAVPLRPYLNNAVPVLSCTSVAELYFGANLAGWGTKKITALEAALRPYLIAPYAPDMARLWGERKAQARRQGHALGQNQHANDLWICVTAIYYNAPLLTGNRRHFEGVPGLVLLP